MNNEEYVPFFNYETRRNVVTEVDYLKQAMREGFMTLLVRQDLQNSSLNLENNLLKVHILVSRRTVIEI